MAVGQAASPNHLQALFISLSDQAHLLLCSCVHWHLALPYLPGSSAPESVVIPSRLCWVACSLISLLPQEKCSAERPCKDRGWAMVRKVEKEELLRSCCIRSSGILPLLLQKSSITYLSGAGWQPKDTTLLTSSGTFQKEKHLHGDIAACQTCDYRLAFSVHSPASSCITKQQNPSLNRLSERSLLILLTIQATWTNGFPNLGSIHLILRGVSNRWKQHHM